MFKVIPLNNKIPLIKNWEAEATTDQIKIQAWKNQFNGSFTRVGIPTGPVNGILVFDVDAKDGGLETIKTLQIPKTMTQRTQSGGIHFIFKYPNDGKQYGNRTKFLPGCDLRGVGGQIAWYGADNTPIADAPSWLLESAIKSTIEVGTPIQVATTVAEGLILKSLDNIKNAPQGESNDILNTESFKVGQLVAAGSITKDFAYQSLMSAALLRGKPQGEAHATIMSALSGSASKPLTSPFTTPPPFEIPVSERWTPKKFTVMDLLNSSKLRKPQLFKNWSTEDIHITTADGGTGKTTLKLYEAICLALGDRFLGFDCIQPGKTLFITGEDTAAKLGAMIGAIVKQMGLMEDTKKLKIVLESIVVKKDSDLCIINKDKMGFLHPNSIAMAKVLEAVKDIQPKMIVFDPISSFWGSEAALNDMAKAVVKFMSHLVDQSGACVEIINHMGKVSSKNKDMSQFAGRGGTGLPSHARVSRVLRSILEDEFTEITGKNLEHNQSAMVCNVGKFTDGSPLVDKPFLILREGFLFQRVKIEATKARDMENKLTAQHRVMKFMKGERSMNKYPTKGILIAHFKTCGDPLPESQVKNAIEVLMYTGEDGVKMKRVPNPDAMNKESVFILVDEDGVETDL